MNNLDIAEANEKALNATISAWVAESCEKSHISEQEFTQIALIKLCREVERTGGIETLNEEEGK